MKPYWLMVAGFDGLEALVGFGSFAPTVVFVKAAAISGIKVTIGEVRAPPQGIGRREAARVLW